MSHRGVGTRLWCGMDRGGGGSRVRAAARATDWVSSVLCSHVAPLVCDSLHDPCWITQDRHCAGSYGAIWLCASPLESHIVLFLRPDAPVWSHPKALDVTSGGWVCVCVCVCATSFASTHVATHRRYANRTEHSRGGLRKEPHRKRLKIQYEQNEIPKTAVVATYGRAPR